MTGLRILSCHPLIMEQASTSLQKLRDVKITLYSKFCSLQQEDYETRRSILGIESCVGRTAAGSKYSVRWS
jgi:hypothetical protein